MMISMRLWLAKKSTTCISFAVITFFVFLVYANMLHNPMIWDDLEMVQNSAFIHSVSNLNHIFTTSAFGDPFDISKFYRPLQISTYIFDYALWKLNPFGYHLTSLIIHLLSCFLLYLIALRFQFSSRLSLMMTLLFSIHPLHIESVSYISGRGDALNLLFALLTCLAFFKGLDGHKGWLFFTVPLFWCGVLSKENVIILPFILVSYYMFLFKREHLKLHYVVLAILIASASMFALWRINPFHESLHQPLSLIASASFLERCYTLPKIIITYLKLLILPFPLHMEYHFVEKSIWSSYIWGWLPLSIGVLWRMGRYLEPKKALFYMSWFLFGLIPISNIFFTLASTLREHWMYIPSVGLFLFVFEWFSIVYRNHGYYVQRGIQILFFTALITFSLMTIVRNEQWGDPLVFYTHDLAYEPQSFVMENNLGAYYFMEKNSPEKAIVHFKRSVDVSPNKNYSVALNNYGYMLELEGRRSLAVVYYQRAINATHYYLGYSNLSRVYVEVGLYREAFKVIEEGLRYYPHSFQLLLLKAHVLLHSNDFNNATLVLEKLDRTHPFHPGVIALHKKMSELKKNVK